MESFVATWVGVCLVIMVTVITIFTVLAIFSSIYDWIKKGKNLNS